MSSVLLFSRTICRSCLTWLNPWWRPWTYPFPLCWSYLGWLIPWFHPGLLTFLLCHYRLGLRTPWLCYGSSSSGSTMVFTALKWGSFSLLWPWPFLLLILSVGEAHLDCFCLMVFVVCYRVTCTKYSPNSGRKEQFPKTWRTATLSPCIKTKGITVIAITIVGSLYKRSLAQVFAQAILNCLQKLADWDYPESECSFKSELSTTDMIFSLWQLQENRKQTIETAFANRLHRPEIWRWPVYGPIKDWWPT